MTLTEKTLELNVTHELLVLGQGIATLFWGAAAAFIPTPPRPGAPIYAAGLTLRQEARLGWDVSLELPATGATPPWIVFIQFKLGEARTRSTYPGSMFARGASGAHVLFGINNNSHANQHVRLRRTAARLGSAGAAVYALPLVTTEALAKASAGRLLARTVFLAVRDVDRVAVPAIVPGAPRKIAISSVNPALREVRSKPQVLDGDDVGARLLGQVAAVRLHRELVGWGRAMEQARGGMAAPTGRPGRRLAFRLVRYFAYFCGVPEAFALREFGLRPPRGFGRSLAPADGGLETRADGTPGARAPGSGDDYEGALGRAGVMMMARYCRPLVDALASGRWDGGFPEPEGLDLLVEARETINVRMELEADDVSALSRLSYLVI